VLWDGEVDASVGSRVSLAVQLLLLHWTQRTAHNRRNSSGAAAAQWDWWSEVRHVLQLPGGALCPSAMTALRDRWSTLSELMAELPAGCTVELLSVEQMLGYEVALPHPRVPQHANNAPVADPALFEATYSQLANVCRMEGAELQRAVDELRRESDPEHAAKPQELRYSTGWHDTVTVSLVQAPIVLLDPERRICEWLAKGVVVAAPAQPQEAAAEAAEDEEDVEDNPLADDGQPAFEDLESDLEDTQPEQHAAQIMRGAGLADVDRPATAAAPYISELPHRPEGHCGRDGGGCYASPPARPLSAPALSFYDSNGAHKARLLQFLHELEPSIDAAQVFKRLVSANMGVTSLELLCSTYWRSRRRCEQAMGLGPATAFDTEVERQGARRGDVLILPSEWEEHGASQAAAVAATAAAVPMTSFSAHRHGLPAPTPSRPHFAASAVSSPPPRAAAAAAIRSPTHASPWSVPRSSATGGGGGGGSCDEQTPQAQATRPRQDRYRLRSADSAAAAAAAALSITEEPGSNQHEEEEVEQQHDQEGAPAAAPAQRRTRGHKKR